MFGLDNLPQYVRAIDKMARYKAIQVAEAINGTRTKEQRWPLGTQIMTPKGMYTYMRFMPSEKMPSHDEAEDANNN